MKRFILFSLVIIFASIAACKKEYVTGTIPPAPFNPFDTITYPAQLVPEVPIDSNTFVGIHKYIFTTRCAIPGCHDGAFEPDFRTVQSAYNTLVYQPVKKNNTAGTFVYRVVPGNVSQSWLHERITTTDGVLGRMPLYDNMLSIREINRISNWIQQGAPDIFGNSVGIPNANPQSYGLVANINVSGNDIKVDTIRNGNPFFPFLVPNNSNLTIWFGLYDDVQTPLQFTYNKIKFSTDPLNFSNAVELSLVQHAVPSFFNNLFGNNKPYFYSYSVNTATLPNNQIVYFRIYVQDSDHAQPIEIPSGGTQFYIQSYYSLIVSP